MRKNQLILAFFISVASPLHSATINNSPEVPAVQGGLSVSSVTLSKPLTLEACFTLALQQNEPLKNREELIRQAQAKARESLGSALPDLSWVLTDLIQDAASSSGGSGVSGTLTRKERIEHKFHLDQPLFSGAREWSATRGFKKEEARDRYSFQRARMGLFHDVAQSFYAVVLAEASLQNTRLALELSQERLAELKERAKLGKSRESEVLSAKSQVANLKSEEYAHLASVSISREFLSFLIGQDISGTPLQDTFPKDVAVPSLQTALDMAEKRTDILAQQEDVNSKRFRVRYDRGGYWPSLDLSANYYTRRVGFQDGIDWDALFTLGVPIYQGGSNAARVRESLSELRQSENNLNLLLRETRSAVRQALTNLQYSLQEVKELDEAYTTARRSYDLQVKEYRLGLVNNLDVLASLNLSLSTKQNLDEAIIRNKLDYFNLKTTIEDGGPL